jgi:hypothetical protein
MSSHSQPARDAQKTERQIDGWKAPACPNMGRLAAQDMRHLLLFGPD